MKVRLTAGAPKKKNGMIREVDQTDTEFSPDSDSGTLT
jgi:hypothetical protein